MVTARELERDTKLAVLNRSTLVSLLQTDREERNRLEAKHQDALRWMLSLRNQLDRENASSSNPSPNEMALDNARSRVRNTKAQLEGMENRLNLHQKHLNNLLIMIDTNTQLLINARQAMLDLRIAGHGEDNGRDQDVEIIFQRHTALGLGSQEQEVSSQAHGGVTRPTPNAGQTTGRWDGPLDRPDHMKESALGFFQSNHAGMARHHFYQDEVTNKARASPDVVFSNAYCAMPRGHQANLFDNSLSSSPCNPSLPFQSAPYQDCHPAAANKPLPVQHVYDARPDSRKGQWPGNSNSIDGDKGSGSKFSLMSMHAIVPQRRGPLLGGSSSSSSSASTDICRKPDVTIHAMQRMSLSLGSGSSSGERGPVHVEAPPCQPIDSNPDSEPAGAGSVSRPN